MKNTNQNIQCKNQRVVRIEIWAVVNKNNEQMKA